MSGGYAPIADITKTKLFALARWMNKNREQKNVIPESIILKRPGAELAIDPNTGKTLCAENALMPYEFMDEVIWRIENWHESYQELMDAKFIYEEKNEISIEQKQAWLDKFFRRMSFALYKGFILPPATIIDANSALKNDYYQPITSCTIDYKGLTNN
jgi:NH3-dependent NAD+ synthetase